METPVMTSCARAHDAAASNVWITGSAGDIFVAVAFAALCVALAVVISNTQTVSQCHKTDIRCAHCMHLPFTLRVLSDTSSFL
jgi:hypothetical protein